MRGRRFSEDVCWSVVRARYHGLNRRRTAALTGVSERQVRRIQDRYNRTGDVRTEHNQWGVEVRGRISKLTVQHRQVRLTFYIPPRIIVDFFKFIESYLARNCATYLDELQTELCSRFELQVSVSTICSYLKTIGYTYKKVSMS